jgi:DNA-binding CsgD family transcriptional regulator
VDHAVPDAGLTRREHEVLALMVAGMGNAAIAERLVVSRSTVKSHVRTVLRKLGAVNRADAIARSRAAARVTP